MADETKTVELEVQLTDHEKALMGDDLVGLLAQRTGVDEERADAAKDFKRQLDAIEQSICERARDLRSGVRVEYVECRELRNFETSAYQLVRCDTGEVVRERPLTGEERQVPLALGPGEPTAQGVADAIAGTGAALTADSAPIEGGQSDG